MIITGRDKKVCEVMWGYFKGTHPLSALACWYGHGSKGIPARTLNNTLIPPRLSRRGGGGVEGGGDACVALVGGKSCLRVGAGAVWREEGTLASPSIAIISPSPRVGMLASPSLEENPKSLA